MDERYAPLETLCASIFGEILLCTDTQTNEEVVIKTVDLALASKRQARTTNELVHENVRTEVDVLARLNALGGHPNVIAMRDCFVSRDGCMLYVVLDFCDGGDLLDACVQSSSQPTAARDNNVRSQSDDDNDVKVPAAIDTATAPQSHRIPEYKALSYLRDVLAGLDFLHTHGVAHRDLSLENILLRNGRAVIADFGLCVQQELPSPNNSAFVCSELVGKHYYMAPEVVTQTQAYDPRIADIWSLGVAFFILVTSSPPFEMASTQDAGFRFVAKHGVRAVLRAWKLDDVLSPASQDLLARMLEVDPAQRIGLAELLHHPAVAGFPTSPVSASDAL